jgi:outer membrane protein insertion porin family
VRPGAVLIGKTSIVALAAALLALAAALVSSCAHDELSTGIWVHDLQVKGVKALSAGDLEDKLATQKTGWWPFASKKWFDEAAFDLDLQRIKAYYADHGYFDARVMSHQIRKVKKDGVDVVIEVQENSPTVIQSVGFRGFPADAAERALKLAKSRDVSAGHVFDFSAFAELKQRISDRMKEDGYAYGTVNGSVNVDRDKHVAVIEMEAQPGPQTRFGTTTVQGNGGIPAWKLLNRVAWKPGDAYSPHDLSTTQGRLYDLGVFSSVRLDLPEKPVEVADVKISVKPGKLYELRLGGGFGAELQREEIHGRFQLTLNNFLGGLRKLRIRINPAYVVIPSITDVQRSGPAAESDIQLTQPDIFGSNASVHALVGYDLGIAEGYQYVGPRAQVGIDRPFFRGHVLAGGSWNLQYLDFFNVDQDVFNGASDRFFGFRNPYRLAYLEEFIQIDLRNRPLDPTYGGFLLLHAEQSGAAIGSAFEYLKLVPDLRLYAPVGRRVVVAVRGLLGWLATSGGQESPITRRFALGGPSSHRGFGFGRLAPQVRDSQGRLIPVGGDGEVLGSAELRIDVHKIGGAWLDVVPFVDAGNVVARFADLSLNTLNVAVGLSLEYTTPIGVVRGGAGVRVNRLEGDVPDPGQRFAYHITIGEAF